MDKKYTAIGIICLIFAFGSFYFSKQEYKRQAEEEARRAAAEDQNPVPTVTELPDVTEPSTEPASTEAPTAEATVAPLLQAEQPTDTARAPRSKEQLFHLENDFIDVEFTTHGGAVKEVALKKYPAVQGEPEPYIFNKGSNLPALAISLTREGDSVEEFAPVYEMIRRDEKSIEFSLEALPGVELIRRYEINSAKEGAAPYLISHSTRFVNRTPTIYNINRLFVNVGTAPHTESDPSDFLLNFGYYDGEDYETVGVSKFKGGGFLGFFKGDPVKEVKQEVRAVWASAKNQFFASVVTPETPGVGVYVEPVELHLNGDEGKPALGITGSLEIDIGVIRPNAETAVNMELYVGPKEYARLSKLNQRQDFVMQLGFFGFIGKILLSMLLGIEKIVGNFGVAIIIMTIFIRLLLWPLTAKAAQSSKKMAKIQEPLKEVRERYKDKPEKIQAETMKLFKQHKINPAAGCLPILVQLPIFFALFQMLRSASELRFAHFLWINDLSLADTIATVAGFPINPLPLVMGITMHYQMRMTPTTLDSTQQKIFKLMPWIFLIFCYTFASGLVLYWTMSNCFSILQQYLTNKKVDPEEPAEPAPQGQGKGKRRKLKKPPKK